MPLKWLTSLLHERRVSKRPEPTKRMRFRGRFLEVEHLETRLTPATYIVFGTGDGEGAIIPMPNPDEFEATTLRAAITAANNNPGFDVITFQIGGGLRTIQPTSPLPEILDPVNLDGTPPDSPGLESQVIEIDGSKAGAFAHGIAITDKGAGSVVQRLVINRFEGSGIRITGKGGNVIRANIIGTDYQGKETDFGNKRNGIEIVNSPNNLIGFDATQGNVISGNSEDGVTILGSLAMNNQLIGNHIGTDSSGKSAIANGKNGVRIAADASNNIVGDTLPELGNLISGNKESGIRIEKSQGNRIIYNKIGTDVTATQSIPNSENGVLITGLASGNYVGEPGRGNVISGNVLNGVLVIGGSFGRPTDNYIQSNYIGLHGSGTAKLSNGTSKEQDAELNGVLIRDASSNKVISNVISGNGFVPDGTGGHLGRGAGVKIWLDDELGAEALQNEILGNFIGTTADGESGLGNGKEGVLIVGASKTIIGGNTGSVGTYPGNVISDNGGDGIRIAGSAGKGEENVVRGNLIGLGLSLGSDTRLGNAGNGVLVESNNNLIGGAASGDGNVISANNGDGVQIQGASGNKVQRNVIGLTKDGLGDPSLLVTYGNSEGVRLFGGATGNIIGGTVPAAGNIISNNRASGVRITNSDGNFVQANWIGLDGSGLLPAGNGIDGVRLELSSKNTIGGANAAEGNLIAANGKWGITGLGNDNTSKNNVLNENAIGFPMPNVEGGESISGLNNSIEGDKIWWGVGPAIVVSSGSGNRITGVSIGGITGLGIDLGGDGRTANDYKKKRGRSQ